MNANKELILDNLSAFVNQRPGFDLCNYSNMAQYRADYNPAMKDKAAFHDLRRYCQLFSVDVEKYARANSRGRLIISDDGNVEYCTGQYFPTEYRAAACRFLACAIWDYWRNECGLDTWEKIHKRAKEEFGRRTASRFFN